VVIYAKKMKLGAWPCYGKQGVSTASLVSQNGIRPKARWSSRAH
jgi:hypothetical protein